MAREVRALGEELVAEATCSVCAKLCAQPVLSACGHSFCERCLPGTPGDPPRPAACPQCRAPLQPRSPRPSRSLRVVAGPAGAREEAARRPRCPEHGSPLTLYCRTCAALLCALCRDGEHRQHCAYSADEAARDLADTLSFNLVRLRKQKEELNSRKKLKIDGLLKSVASEQQRVRDTFEGLQQFLKGQEKILLAQLDEVSQKVIKKSSEYNSRVLERKSLLDTVIAQTERKREQPVVEFLTDVRSVMDGYETTLVPISPPAFVPLQRTIESLSQKSQLVLDMVAKFKVSLRSEIDKEREEVTLDPETASPHLSLSPDHKTVRLRRRKQNLPDTPKRFTGSPCVLGSQGFTAGRHHWEVEVGSGNSWAVGVALESVGRKESLSSTLGKIWALRLDCDGQYMAVHMSSTPLALQEEPRRIRIHLNCREHQVTFYNVENMTQILQFETCFTQKVFPFFWLWSQETYIQLCD